MSYRSSSKAVTNTTTCSPTAPAGYQAGDLLIAIATQNSAVGVITFPSGWTQVRTDHGAINDGLTASWGWKVATGTDSFSWTLSGSARDFGVIVAAYQNINTSSPIDVSSINGPIAGASSPVSTTATGVTTTGLDDVIHLVAGAPSGGFATTGTWTAPSGMTLRQGSTFTGSGAFAMGSLSDFTQVSSGATGNQTGTWTDAGSTFGYISYLIALTPAPPTNPIQAIKGAWVGGSAQTSISIQPNTAGGSQPVGGTNNAILVLFNLYNPAGETIASVTDNQTGSPNTYSKLRFIGDVQNEIEVELWWCQSPVINLANYIVTGTFSGALSGSDHALIRFIELTGITGVDQGGTIGPAIGSSATATCTSVNTNITDFVISLCAVSFNGTNPTLTSSTSGYTDMGTDNGFLNYVQSDCLYKTTSGIETSAITWTFLTGNSAAGLIQTFKAGSGAGGNVAPIMWII